MCYSTILVIPCIFLRSCHLKEHTLCPTDIKGQTFSLPTQVCPPSRVTVIVAVHRNGDQQHWPHWEFSLPSAHEFRKCWRYQISSLYSETEHKELEIWAAVWALKEVTHDNLSFMVTFIFFFVYVIFFILLTSFIGDRLCPPEWWDARKERHRRQEVSLALGLVLALMAQCHVSRSLFPLVVSPHSSCWEH